MTKFADGATPQSELRELAKRLGHHGFRWSERRYFSDNGIIVYRPEAAPKEGIEEIKVMHNAVLLDYAQGSWRAWILPHGGPRWCRRVSTVAELELTCVAGLLRTIVPPSTDWEEI